MHFYEECDHDRVLIKRVVIMLTVLKILRNLAFLWGRRSWLQS